MTPENLILMIYFILLAIYGFTEIILQRKYSKWNSEKMDSSFIFIVTPFYMSLYLAPLEYYLLRPELSMVTIIIGFAVLCFGTIFRIVSLLTLQHGFSITLEKKAEVKLVTTGAYKYIRHPLYSSVLIMAMSGVILFSTIYCWAFVIITLIGLLSRINKEEKFLLEIFPDYKQYSRKTKKMIPFVY